MIAGLSQLSGENAMNERGLDGNIIVKAFKDMNAIEGKITFGDVRDKLHGHFSKLK